MGDWFWQLFFKHKISRLTKWDVTPVIQHNEHSNSTIRKLSTLPCPGLLRIYINTVRKLLFFFRSRQTSVNYKHTLPHTNTPSKKAREKRLELRQPAEGQLAKRVGERDSHIDKGREQESPYIAYRKSCVRAGNALFGHGDFLAGWETDISSAGLLLEWESHEGLREGAGLIVVGRQLGRTRLCLWFHLSCSFAVALSLFLCFAMYSLQLQTYCCNRHFAGQFSVATNDSKPQSMEEYSMAHYLYCDTCSGALTEESELITFTLDSCGCLVYSFIKAISWFYQLSNLQWTSVASQIWADPVLLFTFWSSSSFKE